MARKRIRKVQSVPEPFSGTLALLGMGAIALKPQDEEGEEGVRRSRSLKSKSKNGVIDS